jgi:hypothetical protein
MVSRRPSSVDLALRSPKELSLRNETEDEITLRSSGELESTIKHFGLKKPDQHSRLGIITEGQSKMFGYKKETDIGSFDDLVRFASNPPQRSNDDDKSAVTKFSEFSID